MNSSSCTSGCPPTCRSCGRCRRTPLVTGRLSSLVARARSAVTGAHAPLSSTFVRFWTVSFPVVAYRSWRWWSATAVAFFAVVVVMAFWVAGSPEVQSVVGTPADIDQLVNHDVESYYSEHPAAAFALQVWVNNSWVAAKCIAMSRVARGADTVRALPERRQRGSDRRSDVSRPARVVCCSACCCRTGCSS